MFNSSFFKFFFGFFLIIAISSVATLVVLPYFDSDDIAETQAAETAKVECDSLTEEC